VADQFAAHVVWMHDDPLMPGRPYLLKIGTRTVAASITEIKHREDVNTFQKLAAKVLRLNEVGFVNIETHEPLAFDPYDVNRDMGAFILIDRLSNLTVGAGMIRFGLRRATNVHWQALDVTKQSRAELKGQRPCCLWFTGLSGAGKSTIANLLEKQLNAHNRHTFILDGDNLRHGLNRDLGFTDADRVENIRRAAHVARLMVDAGLIVLVSFISPFAAERRMARELFDSGEFIEVFVDAPLEVCEARDVKGLYKKARAGQIQNFTGISSRYEIPEKPELRLEAGVKPAEALAGEIYAYLEKGGYI
jgi:bifunctional enzyme CysN/CysC